MAGSALIRIAGYVPLLATAWIAGSLCGRAQGADDLFAAHAQAVRQFSVRLEQLAGWCDQHQLAETARRTRAWLPADRDQRLLLFDPTQTRHQPAPGESSDMADWRGKFAELRAQQADELFSLARRAASEGHASLARELIGGTLRENPAHAEAREALGYQQSEGQWHTSFTLAKHKAGQVWDDRFGWLPRARLARYQQDERYYQGRWISAAQDARLHSQIDTGWEVETEHFSIVTNHSLAAAARCGRKLEQLHAAWRQACGAYTTSAASVLNAPPPRAYKQHQVMVFRNRGEYLQALRGEVPDDVPTTGIYISRRRTAYFYVPDARPGEPVAFDDTVLFHEGVHQLFHESRTAVAAPGEKQNFWLIEGLACYFESLVEHDGYLSLGGTDAERFRAAQYRLLHDAFYVPLEEFSALGRPALQRDPRIARLYSQAAGLTHFFMHAAGGARRDGLLAALAALYTGRDRRSTLAEAMGEDFSKLDEQYQQFMRTAAAQQ